MCPKGKTCVNRATTAGYSDYKCVDLVPVEFWKTGRTCKAELVNAAGCAGGEHGISKCMVADGMVNGTCQALYSASNQENSSRTNNKPVGVNKGKVWLNKIVGGTYGCFGQGCYSQKELCRWNYVQSTCTDNTLYRWDPGYTDRVASVDSVRSVTATECGEPPDAVKDVSSLSCSSDSTCNPDVANVGVGYVAAECRCKSSGGGGTCAANFNELNYNLKGPLSPLSSLVNCMERYCSTDKVLPWLTVTPLQYIDANGLFGDKTFASTCQGSCQKQYWAMLSNNSLAYTGQMLMQGNVPSNLGPIFSIFEMTVANTGDYTFANPKSFFEAAIAVERRGVKKEAYTEIKFEPKCSVETIGEEGTPEYEQFETQVEADIATAIGIDAGRVEIVSIRPISSPSGNGNSEEEKGNDVLAPEREVQASLFKSLKGMIKFVRAHLSSNRNSRLTLLNDDDDDTSSSSSSQGGMEIIFRIYGSDMDGEKSIADAEKEFKDVAADTNSILYQGCQNASGTNTCAKGTSSSSTWTKETNEKVEPEIVGGQGLWWGNEWRNIYLLYIFALIFLLSCFCFWCCMRRYGSKCCGRQCYPTPADRKAAKEADSAKKAGEAELKEKRKSAARRVSLSPQEVATIQNADGDATLSTEEEHELKNALKAKQQAILEGKLDGSLDEILSKPQDANQA